MKKMKGIFGVVLSLVLMLTLTSVPVSAATLSDGLDFTNTTKDVDGTSDGYYWDYDLSTLTVLESGLTIDTSDQYALQLPEDSTIVLKGNLNVTTTHTGNTAYALYVAGNLTVSGTGDIKLNSTGYGLNGYDMSISCNTLEITSGLDSISAGNLSLVTEGDIILTTTALTCENAGIYTWGDVSFTSGGDLVINAEYANGIYVEAYEESDTITFNVSGETTINGAYALYLDGSNYDFASTTITNNGEAVYFNGIDVEDDASIYYNNDYFYTLILQGSGEFYTNSSVYLYDLIVEDSVHLFANFGLCAEGVFTLGANAIAEGLGFECFKSEIYGTLNAGIIMGNVLNIYDGATVIVDLNLLSDFENEMQDLFAIWLSGAGDFMPSINLGDKVILYTPESPANIVLTSGEVDNELDEIPYLLTVTKDGKELAFDQLTETHNAAMYVEFRTVYSVDVTVTGEGSVTPDTNSVVKGEDVTYTFTADEGYEVSEVIVDGESVDLTTSYTFEGVVEDHTLEVVFSEIVVEDTTDTNPDADVDTDEETDTDTDGDDTTVDTSDATNVARFTMMSLLSLLGIVIFRRRQLVK